MLPSWTPGAAYIYGSRVESSSTHSVTDWRYGTRSELRAKSMCQERGVDHTDQSQLTGGCHHIVEYFFRLSHCQGPYTSPISYLDSHDWRTSTLWELELTLHKASTIARDNLGSFGCQSERANITGTKSFKVKPPPRRLHRVPKMGFTISLPKCLSPFMPRVSSFSRIRWLPHQHRSREQVCHVPLVTNACTLLTVLFMVFLVT